MDFGPGAIAKPVSIQIFYLLLALQAGIFSTLFGKSKEILLNADLTRKALEKVGNPNVLVNIISRRVRQLNGGAGGAPARPLLSETAGLGLADIALLEIAEGKLGWEMLTQGEGEESAVAE